MVWLSDFCNYSKSSEIIRNGYLSSGTADAIKIGSTLLPSLDYFQDKLLRADQEVSVTLFFV